MIYSENELKDLIRKMIIDFEDEVVEFKEAKSNYSFNDIGKYFSALGNEANLRCQTAHCGRCEQHFIVGAFTSPTVRFGR